MNILTNYVKIFMNSFRKVQILMNPSSGHQNGNGAILKMLLSMYQSLPTLPANAASWQDQRDFELTLPVQDTHFSALPSLTTTTLLTVENYQTAATFHTFTNVINVSKLLFFNSKSTSKRRLSSLQSHKASTHHLSLASFPAHWSRLG